MANEYKVGQNVSARDIIGDTLCEMAAEDNAVWALTSDCGGNLQRFAKEFPDRYVDTGIAEQSAAGIAAGLALDGAIPHIMGMAPFVTMRCFEQNRTDIGYQNLPVRIIASCGGMTSMGGSTHYAMEDISIMRSIANMSVVSISDPLMAGEALRVGRLHKGPIYVRLALGRSDPVIYEPGSLAFQFGKGLVVREGNDAAILTHGAMVNHAMAVSDALKPEGIGVRVVDMLSLKPIDEELILRSVKETGCILVWEDHFLTGGLGSIAAEIMLKNGTYPAAFKQLGIPELYPGFGPDKALYGKYGMDDASAVAVIRDMLKKVK